jgi:hypothetical protein
MGASHFEPISAMASDEIANARARTMKIRIQSPNV